MEGVGQCGHPGPHALLVAAQELEPLGLVAGALTHQLGEPADLGERHVRLAQSPTDPQPRDVGVFCQDCDIAVMTEHVDMDTGGVMAHAVDPDEAARLWDLSAELTGVTSAG